MMGAVFPQDAIASLSIVDVSPSEINSPDQVVIITASASGLSDKSQYLQAVFTKEGQAANYLGFTKNLNGDWYKYKSSPSDSDLTSFFSFKPDSGSWSGRLEAKIDVSDTGFSGPGNYLLKLAKYISSSAVYSEARTIAVKAVKPEAPKPPEPEKKETRETKTTESVEEAPAPVTLAETVKVPEDLLAEENDNGEILGTEEAKIATEESPVLLPTLSASVTPTRKTLVAGRQWGYGWGAVGVGAILLGGSGWLLYNRYRRQK